MNTRTPIPKITGAKALAYGVLEAGVQLVTGYPGSPATAVVDAVQRLAGEALRVEWAINEKSAFDAAFGASLAGVPSLVCLKSVGLNVALDSLMVSNLAGGDGGFVLLVGDDPGGWGSQNEQDSRLLAAAAEVPLLEPISPADAPSVMYEAFALSRRFQVPVVVRITRALAVQRVDLFPPPKFRPAPQPARFERRPERLNVLPIHVVDFHQRLQATLDKVQARFEHAPLNVEDGQGVQGIIAAGYAAQKLGEVLAASGSPRVRILKLSTLHPLPTARISVFARQVDAALILEETMPYVETGVQAIAQRAGLTLPIYGRSSGHLPRAGELFAPHLALGLTSILPEWPWPTFEEEARPRPSREPLCDDCPYVPLFEALQAVMERLGGRDHFVITGETGCMVRAQLPPWNIMDLKYGMGSSIGLAAGLARSGIPQKIVALSGDSALLHSGLGELIDAAQADVALLVVVLANETTALSGGQPHPATGRDAQGRPRTPLDLVALIRAAGAPWVRVVDPEDGAATQAALAEGLAAGHLAVVVARQACPRWEGASE